MSAITTAAPPALAGLAANRRPCLSFPLRHPFEHSCHVAHPPRRHRAGEKMDFERSTAEVIAEAIASEIGSGVDHRDVESDGGDRAAARRDVLLSNRQSMKRGFR